jgi:hypothetical protein
LAAITEGKSQLSAAATGGTVHCQGERARFAGLDSFEKSALFINAHTGAKEASETEASFSWSIQLQADTHFTNLDSSIWQLTLQARIIRMADCTSKAR